MAGLLNVMTIRRNRVSWFGIYFVIAFGIILSMMSLLSNIYSNNDGLNETSSDLPMRELSTHNESQQPSAVIFTTFKNELDRTFLQYNTIRNWASFLPSVQPVLFTTSRRGDLTYFLEQMARDYGWHVYPAPSLNNNGIPFIRPMFEFIELTYSGVILRGYSNGDLLFDGSLLNILQLINLQTVHLNKSVLIGNHTVCDSSIINKKEAFVKHQLRAYMDNIRSTTNGSKGYIFLGGPFSWEIFPGLVVGNSGVINVVGNVAACHGAKIIDGTNVLLAVHQHVKDGTKAADNFAYVNTDAVVNAYGLANARMIRPVPIDYRIAVDFIGKLHIVEKDKDYEYKKFMKNKYVNHIFHLS